VVFLRQVAPGHFVDLTPLGIFVNLLQKEEKNVTLKEKHLHAKYQALFQLCFTKFSQKKVCISNVIIFKNEKVFSKMILFEAS
jgi:hypothetical protein